MTRYLDGLADRKYRTLEQAREQRFVIDFKRDPPPKPNLVGTKVFKDVDIASIVPYVASASSCPPSDTSFAVMRFRSKR